MIDFTDLRVWQKARTLCIEAYKVGDALPPKERFRLTDQLCRAAVSVVNNIAEGFGRGGGKDFAYHLRIARGSTNETRCCGMIACDLKYLHPSTIAPLDGLAVECGKMLTTLLKRVGGLT